MTATATPTAAKAPRGKTTAIEEARATVRQLRGLERAWSDRWFAGARALADRDRRSGDEVLEASLAGDGTERVRALAGESATARAELDTIDRTIAATRARREAAIPTVWQNEAAAILAGAAELRAEADQREVRTRELLAELEAHEDVAYMAAPPFSDGQGGWETPRPRSERLRLQAAQLVKEANAIYARQVVRHGSLTADSIEQLVDAVLEDEMRIGPPVPALVAWADRAASDHEARLRAVQTRQGDAEARAHGLGRPIRFAITWRDGELVAAESGVSVIRDAEEGMPGTAGVLDGDRW